MIKDSNENDSYLLTPKKTFRVRRKIIQQTSSYKTLKIAKKIMSNEGLPKPLTSEEDFVFESRGKRPEGFLSTVSAFYEIPEVYSKRKVKEDDVSPRNVVGPFETFKKKLIKSSDKDLGEIIQKTKQIIEMTGPSLSKLSEALSKHKLSALDCPSAKKKVEKIHEKRQEYWQKVNRNLNRQATIKTKLKRRNTIIMNSPIT